MLTESTSHQQRRGLIAVGATPPPVHGASLATRQTVDCLHTMGLLEAHLETRDDRSLENVGRFDLTNLRLGLRHWVSFARLAATSPATGVYLPLSPSRWGFLRDAGFIWLAKAWRKSVYAHMHGGTGIGDLYASSPAPLRRVIKSTLALLDQAWVLTPSLAEVYVGLIARDRIRVLENVVEDPTNGARPREDRTSERFRILYLSNLIPEKGCLELLDAVHRSEPQATDWWVRIAGATTDGSTLRAAEVKAARLRDAGTRAEIVGPVYGEDKARELRWADVFVLPTHYRFEAQPLALLEALAAGLPIVSTVHAGIPDTARHDVEALLVPPGDLTALRQALVRLSEDEGLRVRLAQQARRRYEEKYAPANLRSTLGGLLALPAQF